MIKYSLTGVALESAILT